MNVKCLALFQKPKVGFVFFLVCIPTIACGQMTSIVLANAGVDSHDICYVTGHHNVLKVIFKNQHWLKELK